MTSFEMKIAGPLFTGALAAASDKAVRMVEDSVANRVVSQVEAQLSNVIRHSTGYYESHIQTERTTRGRVVDDDGVIYGPWLEGVGSRNKTTRFKGYHTFRLIGQRMANDAVTDKERQILQAALGLV